MKENIDIEKIVSACLSCPKPRCESGCPIGNHIRDFIKAVKNGNVWCTERNMYQETTALGEMIQSFHSIFTDDEGKLDEVPFFYRLK